MHRRCHTASARIEYHNSSGCTLTGKRGAFRDKGRKSRSLEQGGMATCCLVRGLVAGSSPASRYFSPNACFVQSLNLFRFEQMSDPRLEHVRISPFAFSQRRHISGQHARDSWRVSAFAFNQRSVWPIFAALDQVHVEFRLFNSLLASSTSSAKVCRTAASTIWPVVALFFTALSLIAICTYGGASKIIRPHSVFLLPILTPHTCLKSKAGESRPNPRRRT